jgi:hypothetical protein
VNAPADKIRGLRATHADLTLEAPKWDANGIASCCRTDRYFRGKSPTEAGRIGADEPPPAATQM